MKNAEGDIRITAEVYQRRECDGCGEPATKIHTFCCINGRRNPASSMYGRDDCTYCADSRAYACDACDREVLRVCCPDGMNWAGTFTLSERNGSMFMEWIKFDPSIDDLKSYIAKIKEQSHEKR